MLRFTDADWFLAKSESHIKGKILKTGNQPKAKYVVIEISSSIIKPKAKTGQQKHEENKEKQKLANKSQ